MFIKRLLLINLTAYTSAKARGRVCYLPDTPCCARRGRARLVVECQLHFNEIHDLTFVIKTIFAMSER